MKADPLAPVGRGDEFDTSAASENAKRELLRRVRAHPPFRPDPPRAVGLPPTLAMRVRNDTGGDLAKGSIVVPVTPVPDPTTLYYEFLSTPAFGAEAAAAVTDQPFVLLEPIPEDEYGMAAVMGVALCYVNVQSASHLFAYPEVGDTANLKSSRDGPVRILWPAGTVGSSVLCAVLLGIGPGGPGLCTPFVQDWSCVSNVATVTKKGLWLPPGMATLYDDEAACDSANPGA